MRKLLHQFSRNELAIGQEGLQKLKNSTVAVLGVGGVGSFAVEALARSAIGRLILVDKDDVDITNINRQIPALLSTVGQAKADLMKKRIADINPDCDVISLKMFYTEETAEQFFSYKPDYVVDASDTIIYKVHVMKECLKRKIKIISSMGAANKMDPTRLRIADISETHTDPIARVVRLKLRKEGIKKAFRSCFPTKARSSSAKRSAKWSVMMKPKPAKRKCHHHPMRLFRPLQGCLWQVSLSATF